MSTLAYGIAKRHELLKTTLLQGHTGIHSLKSLSCDVVFGSPNVGCRGTGICKLNAHGVRKTTALRQSCRGAAALLVPLDGGEGVALLLPREFLCAHILRRHLRYNTLQMSAPCKIPPGFVAALGLKIQELSPGHYPVIQTDGFYRIDFR